MSGRQPMKGKFCVGCGQYAMMPGDLNPCTRYNGYARIDLIVLLKQITPALSRVEMNMVLTYYQLKPLGEKE